MTHQIRKLAPKGAHYWQILNGRLWFFKIDDDDNVSVDFMDGNGWEIVAWIDAEYIMRNDVHALECESLNCWVTAVALVILFVSCGESFVEWLLL
jgi:hypothetical protein